MLTSTESRVSVSVATMGPGGHHQQSSRVRFLVVATFLFCSSRVTGYTAVPVSGLARRRNNRVPAHYGSRGDTTTAPVEQPSSPVVVPETNEPSSPATTLSQSSFSYVAFAQSYPFANNLLIATTKTAAADLLAQTVISGTPLTELDLQRSLLFCLFGAVYLGAFQYLYQVQIFKRLFDVDSFTQQPWKDKLQDTEGLKALAGQTILDLTVLTAIYLPTFYIFKASVFSGSFDPSVWVS